jgi:YesN/AraC family two-component response regulator
MVIQLNTKTALSMMIVEDEASALQLLSEVLVAMYPDITHYSAINGKIGLELFKTHLPDIVITDINMPELTGNRLADNINRIKANTKLIAITGKSCNIGSEDINSKFHHIIEKPLNFQELFTLIDQCKAELEQHESIHCIETD